MKEATDHRQPYMSKTLSGMMQEDDSDDEDD